MAKKKKIVKLSWLEPRTVSADTWFYINRGSVTLVHQVRDSHNAHVVTGQIILRDSTLRRMVAEIADRRNGR